MEHADAAAPSMEDAGDHGATSCLRYWGIERMVFVLKRTPAFQLFGPFQRPIAG
jgi:hypothetical protein